VSESAQETAQYDLVGVEFQEINRTVEVLGQERRIVATNHVATYERDLGVTTADAVGNVVIVSTPEMSVAGQSVNPVGSMGPESVLRTLGAGQGVSDLSAQGNRTVTVLGEDATVTVFGGTTTIAGQEVDVTAHFLRVAHEGDYVIGLAVHPAVMSPDQAGVDAMFAGIEHIGSE
jgi:hypothetical protein